MSFDLTLSGGQVIDPRNGVTAPWTWPSAPAGCPATGWATASDVPVCPKTILDAL